MEMKRRIIFIILISSVIFIYPIVFNIFFIGNQIYVDIKYDTDISNEKAIIKKAENLNYSSFFNFPERSWGDLKYYIDKDVVEDLKEKVENSKKQFHWFIMYSHHLKYHFQAKFYSEITLKYDNDTIYELKTGKGRKLYNYKDDYSYEDRRLYFNHSIIPESQQKNTTTFSKVYFINMTLDYGYYCGMLCARGHKIWQYVFLDLNLNVILIFYPYTISWIS